MTTVRDNRTELRYELLFDGRRIGEIRYRIKPDAVPVIHTHVDPAYEDNGYATRPIDAALRDGGDPAAKA